MKCLRHRGVIPWEPCSWNPSRHSRCWPSVSVPSCAAAKLAAMIRGCTLKGTSCSQLAAWKRMVLSICPSASMTANRPSPKSNPGTCIYEGIHGTIAWVRCGVSPTSQALLSAPNGESKKRCQDKPPEFPARKGFARNRDFLKIACRFYSRQDNYAKPLNPLKDGCSLHFSTFHA